MTQVLVINAGSSSLKYALVDPGDGRRSVTGTITRIGEDTAEIRHTTTGHPEIARAEPVADHVAAFALLRGLLDATGAGTPDLVGHRVVHGGAALTRPVLIDEPVIAEIERCAPLAPLHNPPALTGIASARAAFPDVPHVAVFDTAFHATIPDAAATYPVAADVAARYRLRKYGFHGTSHQYVAGRAADVLGRDPATTNVITLHLGNGASACAVRGGVSVDTSMGYTPLEGLMMGSRTGDVDPAIALVLARDGYGVDDLDDLFNRRSGLVGICGDNDLRVIHRRAESGDAAADLARRMFAHRVRKYLGAYLVVLGEVHAVVFTAGIGEHDAWMRAAVCAGLERLGIRVDAAANAAGPGTARRISPPDADPAVLVIPTDEEHAIARLAAPVVP